MRLRRNAMIIMGSLGLVLLSISHAMAQSGDGGYRIFQPDGPGHHPGVVFASGCSGFTVSQEYVRLAEELRDQGYVVVFADYLGRRNLKVCDGGAVSLSDAGKDIVAAAAWLKSQPSIDPTRIAAIGWSYGGGAVLTALAEHSQEQLIFSRAIVYYAVCREVVPWKVTIPVLMLFGSEDHVTPAKACQQVAQESSARGHGENCCVSRRISFIRQFRIALENHLSIRHDWLQPPSRCSSAGGDSKISADEIKDLTNGLLRFCSLPFS